MTDRDAARRPTAEQVATDLHAMAVGGQATTVIAAPRPPAADRTQVLDRTQLMTSAAPVAAAAPAVAAPVARQRSTWPVVVALVTVVAVLLLGALFLSQRGPTTVPSPVPVDQSVPNTLKPDLNKLQVQVRR